MHPKTCGAYPSELPVALGIRAAVRARPTTSKVAAWWALPQGKWAVERVGRIVRRLTTCRNGPKRRNTERGRCKLVFRALEFEATSHLRTGPAGTTRAPVGLQRQGNSVLMCVKCADSLATCLRPRPARLVTIVRSSDLVMYKAA